MKTVENWVKEIETQRLKDEKEQDQEQREFDAQYDAYISQYKSYSAEEMRDYGHTWGPGFDEESEPIKELAEYDKVNGKQLEILEAMVKNDHPDDDIRYIFLGKCAWDDDYPICKLGKEYEYENVLLLLVEKYRSEAEFYQNKVNNNELVWAKL